jgi:hypothetical protein
MKPLHTNFVFLNFVLSFDDIGVLRGGYLHVYIYSKGCKNVKNYHLPLVWKLHSNIRLPQARGAMKKLEKKFLPEMRL